MAQGSNTDRRRVLLIFLSVGVGVTLIDQITKYLSVSYLENSDPVRLLWGAVYLTLVRNSGAAFSLGTDITFVFPLVALVVLTVLGFVIWRVRSVAWAVALGLVLGGVIGNLGDRLFRSPGPLQGHVVDVVSLLAPDGRVWPVFNAADSSIVCGGILLVLLALTGRELDGSSTRSRKDGAAEENGA